MQIAIDHLAVVEHACVDIDGITVIAGVNDTGKSTVSKALWCMFDSLYKYEKQFESYREDMLASIVKSRLRRNPTSLISRNFLVRKVVQSLTDNWDAVRCNSAAIEDCVEGVCNEAAQGSMDADFPFDERDFAQLCREIELISSYDDAQLMCGVMSNNFLSEFTGQPNNVDAPGDRSLVTLAVQGTRVAAAIVVNRVQQITSLAHLDVRAIYIDDASIVDDVAYGYRSIRQANLFDEDRHQRLQRLLRRSTRRDGNVLRELVTSTQLEDVMRQLRRASPGELYWASSRELNYVPEGYANSLNAKNISAGMKVFSILELLLQNGAIERKSTIILDEPEVHLHPEWQLLFAELLVLLQRTFELHVLLTTHSPYFLRAIQVFAAKHSMATQCRYYHAERKGKMCQINDVTNATEDIFRELVKPFETLEAEAVAL